MIAVNEWFKDKKREDRSGSSLKGSAKGCW
jgi:hypothetical protein